MFSLCGFIFKCTLSSSVFGRTQHSKCGPMVRCGEGMQRAREWDANEFSGVENDHFWCDHLLFIFIIIIVFRFDSPLIELYLQTLNYYQLFKPNGSIRSDLLAIHILFYSHFCVRRSFVLWTHAVCTNCTCFRNYNNWHAANGSHALGFCKPIHRSNGKCECQAEDFAKKMEQSEANW